MDSKEFGLVAAQQLFKIEDIHYGFWEDGENATLGNWKQAQEAHTEFLFKHIFKHIESKQTSHILDIGCGVGFTTKKLLELGRTMMVEPKVVLLDEVGAGVNRTLLNEISDAIKRLNKEKNYTFFVIEHDMDLIEKICDPVIVMAEGGVLFEGNFNEVRSNEEVIEAYLGRGIKSKEKNND